MTVRTPVGYSIDKFYSNIRNYVSCLFIYLFNFYIQIHPDCPCFTFDPAMNYTLVSGSSDNISNLTFGWPGMTQNLTHLNIWKSHWNQTWAFDASREPALVNEVKGHIWGQRSSKIKLQGWKCKSWLIWKKKKANRRFAHIP